MELVTRYSYINSLGSPEYIFILGREPITKEWVPQKGQKIHLTSSCTIPRYKLNAIKTLYNISITRDPNKADVIFIGKNFTKTKYLYCSSKAYINNLHSKFKESLTNNVFMSWRASWDFLDRPNRKIEGKKISFFRCEKLFNILNNFSSKLFSESSLLSKVVEDHPTIDKEMYLKIKGMLESDNNLDITMGLALITNSNFESSGGFIYILLSQARHKIIENIATTHIPYKNLLKHFELRNFNMSLSTIIYQLSKRKLFNTEVIEVLKELICTKINTYNSAYKVTEVEINTIYGVEVDQ